MSDIIEVRQADMLAAINRSEVDMQISTAKAYPRDIQQSLNRILTIATLDTETAADCFYALRRGGSLIEGLSVRFVEIIAGSWGNLRVQTRIIGNDGKTITAQGVVHDLETNAASAIAFRNAVLKIVPKSVTKRIVEEVKRVAIGQATDLEATRQKMLDYFGKMGVEKAKVFTYLGVKDIAQINVAMIFELRGLANALREGTATVEGTFGGGTQTASEKAAEEARKKAEDGKRKAEEAMGKAGKAKPAEKPEKKRQVPENYAGIEAFSSEIGCFHNQLAN